MAMGDDEVRSIVGNTMKRATARYSVPSVADWAFLEQRFDACFPQEFRTFMQVMSEFEFPGDLYNIARSGCLNGNDFIGDVYDAEVRDPAFPMWLFPLYGIGNGDYFGLSARKYERSAVYYWDHERMTAELCVGSFAEWLRGLPAFLKG